MSAKKVLLADDEEDIRVVVKMFLESKGFEVETAYDGLDAIDKAKSFLPNVIVLDIMMPLLDGFEVCHRLKSENDTAHIPILMLSAAAHAESVQKALDAGAVGYVMKPFEPDHLHAQGVCLAPRPVRFPVRHHHHLLWLQTGIERARQAGVEGLPPVMHGDDNGQILQCQSGH